MSPTAPQPRPKRGLIRRTLRNWWLPILAIWVGVVGGTSLIEVSMVSESPYEAMTLVNAVVAAFMAANNDWSRGITESQVKTLEDYLEDLKRKSEAVDNDWKKLLSKEDLQ